MQYNAVQYNRIQYVEIKYNIQQIYNRIQCNVIP